MLSEELCKDIIQIVENARDRSGYAMCADIDELAHSYPAEQEMIGLLSQVMSLSLNSTCRNSPYKPLMVFTDGSSSISLHDFYDNTQSLELLYKSNLPCQIRARLADILWLLTKNHLYATDAVTLYLSSGNDLWDIQHWSKCFSQIQRANVLALSLGRNASSLAQCMLFADEKIKELRGEDPLFLSLSLIELQIDNQHKSINDYIPFLDKIIVSDSEFSNIHRIEIAFEIKSKVYKFLKYHNEVKQCDIDLAKYYVTYAAHLLEEENVGHDVNALHFYQKAILIYRKLGLKHEEMALRRTVAPVKKRLAEEMPVFQNSIDLTSTYKELSALMKDRSLEECICLLAMVTEIPLIQDIKQSVIEDSRNYLFKHLFGEVVIDKEGKTIINLSPLDYHNPEKDPLLIKQHMFRKTIEKISYTGIILHLAMQIICADHTIEVSDLDFIFKNNWAWPEDRHHILTHGLYYGLLDETHISIHLLVPQIEYFLRELARMCGGIVSVFDDDTTEQEKTLGSVFDIPELIDCYDEDILFTLRALLSEKAGGNLRNRIAHGLVDQIDSQQGDCLYFISLCLKLCCMYSPRFYEVRGRLNKELKQNSA